MPSRAILPRRPGEDIGDQEYGAGTEPGGRERRAASVVDNEIMEKRSSGD
jgi:hypothetical protein